MMSFHEYVSESSLGRFYQHLKNEDNVIAIVTSYRNENTKKENEENNSFLKTFIKRAKFGYVRMEGGYTEIKSNGAQIDVTDEISFAIFTSKEREKELLNFVISMGKRFKQDSILFVDSNKKVYWISTRNDSSIGTIDSKKELGDFHTNNISNYYSKIGKKKFSFDIKEEYVYSLENTKSSQFRREQDIFCSMLRRAVREEKGVMDIWELPVK